MPLPAAANVCASGAHIKLLSPASFTPFSPSAMKSFLDALSNSGPAVRRYSEGGNRPTRRPLQENVVTQYLVAIYHPDDYDPSTEDEAMSRDIDALNDEMKEPGQHREVAASTAQW